MAVQLLFLCIYVDYNYLPHFVLDILLNFAHDSEVRKAYLLALKQKNLRFDRYYERGLCFFQFGRHLTRKNSY